MEAGVTETAPEQPECDISSTKLWKTPALRGVQQTNRNLRNTQTQTQTFTHTHTHTA